MSEKTDSSKLVPHPLYTMKLHDIMSLDIVTQVLRVPGGWVYYFKGPSSINGVREVESCVFVPFNNEFTWAGTAAE